VHLYSAKSCNAANALKELCAAARTVNWMCL